MEHNFKKINSKDICLNCNTERIPYYSNGKNGFRYVNGTKKYYFEPECNFEDK